MIEVYGPISDAGLQQFFTKANDLYDQMLMEYERFNFKEQTASMLRELFLLQSILETCASLKSDCEGYLPIINGDTHQRDAAVFQFSERLIHFCMQRGLYHQIETNVFLLSEQLISGEISDVIELVAVQVFREVLTLYHRMAKEPLESVNYKVLSIRVASEFHELSDMLGQIELVRLYYGHLPEPYKDADLLEQALSVFSRRVHVALLYAKRGFRGPILSADEIRTCMESGTVTAMKQSLNLAYKNCAAVCRSAVKPLERLTTRLFI